MPTEKYERPAYRVLDVAGFFGDDDTLYPEGSEVVFDGEPCIEMEPLNEAARQKMIELYNKLDEFGRAAAEKAGRPYTGMPRNLEGGLALANAVQRAEIEARGKTGCLAKHHIAFAGTRVTAHIGDPCSNDDIIETVAVHVPR